jgi:hypothetical protein
MKMPIVQNAIPLLNSNPCLWLLSHNEKSSFFRSVYPPDQSGIPWQGGGGALLGIFPASTSILWHKVHCTKLSVVCFASIEDLFQSITIEGSYLERYQTPQGVFLSSLMLNRLPCLFLESQQLAQGDLLGNEKQLVQSSTYKPNGVLSHIVMFTWNAISLLSRNNSNHC